MFHLILSSFQLLFKTFFSSKKRQCYQVTSAPQSPAGFVKQARHNAWKGEKNYLPDSSSCPSQLFRTVIIWTETKRLWITRFVNSKMQGPSETATLKAYRGPSHLPTENWAFAQDDDNDKECHHCCRVKIQIWRWSRTPHLFTATLRLPHLKLNLYRSTGNLAVFCVCSSRALGQNFDCFSIASLPTKSTNLGLNSLVSEFSAALSSRRAHLSQNLD